jgi:hypothetical protein
MANHIKRYQDQKKRKQKRKKKQTNKQTKETESNKPSNPSTPVAQPQENNESSTLKGRGNGDCPTPPAPKTPWANKSSAKQKQSLGYIATTPMGYEMNRKWNASPD